MCCFTPTKAWSYIITCAGVTAVTWAAHLKNCMIELYSTPQNPSETNPYSQESCCNDLKITYRQRELN